MPEVPAHIDGLPCGGQTPTVGRIVHYRLNGSEVQAGNRQAPAATVAAVIVRVWNDDGMVNLRLLLDGPPTADEWRTSIAYDPELPGAWSWPPRVG